MLHSAPATKRTVSNHKVQYQRPRLQKHFVQTPQVLLRGYPQLSDGAKLTYLVLLSFDYLDAESVTVRRLHDEVEWVLAARDAMGPSVGFAPPPVDTRFTTALTCGRRRCALARTRQRRPGRGENSLAPAQFRSI